MDENGVRVTERVTGPNRRVWVERMRKAYPDRADLEDEEGLFGALQEYDDERAGRMERFTDSNRRLTELFTENPEVGMFVSDLMEGSDVMTAMGECFGNYFETVLRDPESKAKYEAGLEMRRKHQCEMEEIRKRQADNAERNAETIEAFIAEKGMDGQVRKQFEGFISDMIDRVFLFDYDRDLLERLWRAMNYDTDMEEASAQGETRGRNAKIKLEMRRPGESDGVPMITQGANDAAAGRPGLRVKRSIWD